MQVETYPPVAMKKKKKNDDDDQKDIHSRPQSRLVLLAAGGWAREPSGSGGTGLRITEVLDSRTSGIHV